MRQFCTLIFFKHHFWHTDATDSPIFSSTPMVAMSNGNRLSEHITGYQIFSEMRATNLTETCEAEQLLSAQIHSASLHSVDNNYAAVLCIGGT